MGSQFWPSSKTSRYYRPLRLETRNPDRKHDRLQALVLQTIMKEAKGWEPKSRLDLSVVCYSFVLMS